MSTFTIYHGDHDITEEQMDYIKSELNNQEDGFFIKEIKIPGSMGVVPCGLYGPAMGDDPVEDDEIDMVKRSPDRPADRIVGRPYRQVNYVQVIGIREGDKFTIFTVYGGPLAPKNPEDPTLTDDERDESINFWSEHALTISLD